MQLVNFETDLQSLSFDEDIQLNTEKTDELVFLLTRLLDYEEKQFDIKNVSGKTFNIDLKGLSTEELIAVYRFLLNRDTLVNARLILNLQTFINGYSTYDDSFFECKEIYLCNIEQILDIKLALSKELKDFQTKISYWFLACLKSMHKVEYTALDPLVVLPPLYKRILLASNLMSLSTILSKSSNIETEDLPLVEDAFPIIMELASASAIANQLLQSLNFESLLNQ